MPRTLDPRPPLQKRSRESLRRMLDAAEVVVAKYGIKGATLPRIAAQARITPTNVYRRFRNKDALIRAVFQRLTDRSSAEVNSQFDPETVRPIGLIQFSRNVIAGMVSGYRANAALSRAAVEYSERHWEVAFIRKARAAEAQISTNGGYFPDLAGPDLHPTRNTLSASRSSWWDLRYGK